MNDGISAAPADSAWAIARDHRSHARWSKSAVAGRAAGRATPVRCASGRCAAAAASPTRSTSCARRNADVVVVPHERWIGSTEFEDGGRAASICRIVRRQDTSLQARPQSKSRHRRRRRRRSKRNRRRIRKRRVGCDVKRRTRISHQSSVLGRQVQLRGLRQQDDRPASYDLTADEGRLPFEEFEADGSVHPRFSASISTSSTCRARAAPDAGPDDLSAAQLRRLCVARVPAHRGLVRFPCAVCSATASRSIFRLALPCTCVISKLPSGRAAASPPHSARRRAAVSDIDKRRLVRRRHLSA